MTQVDAYLQSERVHLTFTTPQATWEIRADISYFFFHFQIKGVAPRSFLAHPSGALARSRGPRRARQRRRDPAAEVGHWWDTDIDCKIGSRLKECGGLVSDRRPKQAVNKLTALKKKNGRLSWGGEKGGSIRLTKPRIDALILAVKLYY